MIELMTPEEIAADQQKWLAWRRKLITGSDVASICGVPGVPGPAKVYWEKLTGDDHDDWIQLRVGRALEPLVLEMYAERYPDAKLTDRGLCVHDQRRWQACTFDRIDAATGWPVEAKTSVPKDGFGEPPHGTIPPRMVVQTLWQCDIAGAPEARLPVLFLPHGPFRVYWITVDGDALEDLAFMRAKVRQFVDNHLKPQVPPPVSWDADTTRILKRLHARAEIGAEVTMPNKIRDLLERTVIAQTKADRLAGLAENELRDRLGKATVAVDKDGRVIAKRSLSWPGRIDLDMLRTRFPEVAAACTVTRDEDNPVDTLRVRDYWKHVQ